MRLNRTTEYAIHILVDLASHPPGEPVISREIAERHSIPQNYIAQILMVLGDVGWTEGIRGYKGGIVLKIDPSTITIRDVIEAVQGPVAINDCLIEEDVCKNHSECPLHDILEKAQEEMLKVLDTVSISDLTGGRNVGNTQDS